MKLASTKETTVTTIKADARHRPVVENLIQLYLYDMTASLPFPIGNGGRFEYEMLDRFWQHPYLIFQDDELAGFALVIDECPVTGTAPCFFMAEFFVLKAYRGKGIGMEAFSQIIKHHSGKWHIGVINKNEPACAFWKKATANQKPETFSKLFDNEEWQLYEFTATPPSII